MRLVAVIVALFYILCASPSQADVTTSYTVNVSDCGQTLVMAGGMNTVTLPSSGFSENCAVTVLNKDTRAKKLSGFPPGQPSFLWPMQAIVVQVVGGAWQNMVKPGRWRPPDPLALYVDSRFGDDNNDGLAAGAGGALKTMQKAWDNIVTYVDTAGQGPTVYAAAGGTYSVKAGPMPPVGGGVVTFIGDPLNPRNVVIAPPAPGPGIQAIGGATYIRIGGFYCNSPNNVPCVYADINSGIEIADNMDFGVSAVHMQASHAMIFVNHSYTISGPAAYHDFSGYGAQIEYGHSVHVTVTNNPSFTFFAFAALGGYIAAVGANDIGFSGAAVGQRYASADNSVIDATGGGQNAFPGTIAGAAVNGGKYVP